MYTQCPDCATAFRVTAEILKQAGGKVRCGGCSIAFNALEYLSETKPAEPPPENDGAVPELTPDPVDKVDDAPPRAISPEQSAALLKTLDELAGSDIRLEDTGVEWRLMGDDEADDNDDDALQLSDDTGTAVDAELSGDTGNTAIDELLDDTPADVDEFLEVAPSEVEAVEVFGAADSNVESPEIFSGDAVAETIDSVADNGDPVDEPGDDELRFDDHTGLPDDDDDDESRAAPVIAFENDEEPEPEPEFIEPAAHTETQVDIVFGEPDEWGELLDEVDVGADDDAAVEVRGEIIEPDVDADDSADAALTIEDELDLLDDELPAEHEDIPESTGELESELARAQDLSDKILTALSRHGVDDFEDADVMDDIAEASDDSGELSLELDDLDGEPDDVPELAAIDADDGDASADDTPDIPEPVILPETEEEQTINRMIDQDLLALAADDGDDKNEGAAHPVIDVPGFPSMDAGVETIIMEGEFVRTALEEEALAAEAAQNDEEEATEHSFIAAAKKTFRGTISRYTDDDEDAPESKRNYRIAAGLALLGVLLGGQLVHQSRAELATIPAVNNVIAPIYRMIGSPITPQWDVTGWKFEVTRETLSGGTPVASTEVDDVADAAPDTATENPAADDAAAADAVAGIEAAKTPEILTIYSRLGNSADHPLPYPLITVSLTDRYEETIGSTILEPSDYLPAQADTTRLVSPGNTFEAVIPIDSPSGNATGYKLNVCYRQTGSNLRCAVADFK